MDKTIHHITLKRDKQRQILTIYQVDGTGGREFGIGVEGTDSDTEHFFFEGNEVWEIINALKVITGNE